MSSAQGLHYYNITLVMGRFKVSKVSVSTCTSMCVCDFLVTVWEFWLGEEPLDAHTVASDEYKLLTTKRKTTILDGNIMIHSSCWPSQKGSDTRSSMGFDIVAYVHQAATMHTHMVCSLSLSLPLSLSLFLSLSLPPSIDYLPLPPSFQVALKPHR